METPEQVQLQFALAGVGSRFLALATDTLVQIAVGACVFAVLFVLGLGGIVHGWGTTSLWLTAALIASVFLIQFGYFALFEIFWNGQTPGKRTIGIRVVKDSGRPLSVPETIARNLLRIVDQLPGFYAIGVLVATTNAQSKRLGDFVAGSIVVHENAVQAGEHPWEHVPDAASSTFLGANRLTPEELGLIDAFLTRRSELPSDVRYRISHEMLQRLEPKLTLSEDDRARVERTLESVAHEHRSRGRYS